MGGGLGPHPASNTPERFENRRKSEGILSLRRDAERSRKVSITYKVNEKSEWEVSFQSELLIARPQVSALAREYSPVQSLISVAFNQTLLITSDAVESNNLMLQ